MTKSYKRKWIHKGGIIRQRGNGFQVEINFNSKRIRETLDSLDVAKLRIEQLYTELKNKGLDSLALTPEQHRDAAMAIKVLPANTSLHDSIRDYALAISRLDATPLAEAVDFFLSHHKPVGGIKTVAELVVDFSAAKSRLGRRDRTLKDIRCRMNRFAEEFGPRHIHTIRSEDIDAWLDSSNYKGQSRINYCRVLSGFFNYARKLRLIQVNPADREHIDRPKLDEHLPVIFPVAAVEKLMAIAQVKTPQIIPYVALGFFAGLRTAELDGLDWSNIHIDQKLITVKPEIAKRRRQRHVDMSENLAAWLSLNVDMKGPVRVKGVRKLLELLIKESKVDWIHNGMRHTYASHHIAKHQDFSKTALQLGHVGRTDVLVNHYRNLVTASECDRYWKIAPVNLEVAASD